MLPEGAGAVADLTRRPFRPIGIRHDLSKDICLYTRPLPENYPAQKDYLDKLEATLTGFATNDPPLPGAPVKFKAYQANARRLGMRPTT